MSYRRLSILACCVAVGVASATQPAPDNSDDQAKALEALRQAENAQPATPPVEQPAPKKKPAKKPKKTAPPVVQQPAPAPAAATAPVPAASSQDQAQALEALRQAEGGRPAAAATAPAAPV